MVTSHFKTKVILVALFTSALLLFQNCSEKLSNPGPSSSVDLSQASQAGCPFNGSTIANGTSIPAYATASVATGQTCQSQTRNCSGGVLSGTYQFSSCTAGAATCPADSIGNCTLPATASGSLAGTCVGGFSGSCSYSCQNANWTMLNNSCAIAQVATTGTLCGDREVECLNGGTIAYDGSGSSNVACLGNTLTVTCSAAMAVTAVNGCPAGYTGSFVWESDDYDSCAVEMNNGVCLARTYGNFYQIKCVKL